MNEHHTAYIDQSKAMCDDGLNALIRDARNMAARGTDTATTWAILTYRLGTEVHKGKPHPDVIVGMVVNAAMRLAETN